MWIQGRPANPGKVDASGEVTNLVKALESILPADWTIWAPENLARLILAVGGPVAWDGNGREWPEVLEALAPQYGMEITADIVNQRAVLRLPSSQSPPVAEQVAWNGYRQAWPAHVDTAAQPTGMKFAADFVNREAAIGNLLPHPPANTPGDPVEMPGNRVGGR